MASLSLTNITSSSVQWSVSGLSSYWNSVNYSYIAIGTGTTTDGSTTAPSGTLDTVYPSTSGYGYSTTTRTITGLTAGKSYTLRAYSKAKNGKWYFIQAVTFNTLAPPQPPSQPYVTYTSTLDSITISWSSVYGATSYNIYYNGNYRNSTTSTSYAFTGLAPSTSYLISVSAKNANGESVTHGGWFTTQSPPRPSTPTGLVASSITETSIKLSWNASSNATAYHVYLGGTYKTSTSNLYHNYTGLTAGNQYQLVIYAYNQYSESGSSYIYATTNDTTAPIINNLTVSGNVSAITIEYSASDNSGKIAGYDVYISSRNGGTPTLTPRKANTTLTTYSFYTDINGKTFDSGTYYVGVKAYDAKLNYSTMKTAYITIVGLKPSTFSWSTTKSSNSKFDITATEWNSFTTRINQFRNWKNLSAYSFTYANKGYAFTADMYNEARNSIYAMNPPTTIPAIRYKGSSILASDINRLVSSLNSIT